MSPQDWLRRRRRLVAPRRDSGAAAVEFAMVAMPLSLLLFGIIEFGWAFFQMSDVRHGAREGLRVAAVNGDPTPDGGAPSNQGERIAQETCERMDRKDGATVSITLVDADADGEVDLGDEVTVNVSRNLDQLTGFLDFMLAGTVLDESVTSRLEQDPDPSLDGVTWTCA